MITTQRQDLVPLGSDKALCIAGRNSLLTAVETGGSGWHQSPLSHGGAAIGLSPPAKSLTSVAFLRRPPARSPAPDQGCPSVWYPARHGCSPAYQRIQAGVSRAVSHPAHAEHAGGPTVDLSAAAAHGEGGAGGLLVGPAAQAPQDRHSGEHRPVEMVSETCNRHQLVVLSQPLHPQFYRGDVDGCEKGRMAAVSERTPSA